MVHRKKRKDAGKAKIKFLSIAIIVLLVVLIGWGRVFPTKKTNSSVVKNTVTASQTATTTIASQILTGDVAKWKRFYDSSGRFEFRYPVNFKKSQAEAFVPPTYKDSVKATTFVYTIPVEHCALSGKCQSTTDNMSISFFLVDKDFNKVYGELKKVFGAELRVATVDGHQGVSVRTGVEGEGVYYYVLPASEAKTLFIVRGYIEESIVSRYRFVSSFIKFSDQTKVFAKLLSTVKFTN